MNSDISRKNGIALLAGLSLIADTDVNALQQPCFI